MSEDMVRVLRVIEYYGPRDEVEKVIMHSVHGVRKINNLEIRASTIGVTPDIIEEGSPLPTYTQI